MPPDERGVHGSHGSHGGSDGAPIVVDMSEPTVDIQAAIDPVVVDAAEPIVADEGASVMTRRTQRSTRHTVDDCAAGPSEGACWSHRDRWGRAELHVAVRCTCGRRPG